MSGWISLHRSIMRHWIMEDAEYFRAWAIILMEVNHKPQKRLIKKVLLECDRGESINSMTTWGKLFGWSKAKVRHFFSLLESDTMVVLKSERVTTRLSVCNYEKYQSEQHTDSTSERPQSDTQRDRRATTNNNGNKDNNGNNTTPLPPKGERGKKPKKEKPVWYDSYEEYRVFVKSAFNEFVRDGGKEWAEETYPNIDYSKTMQEMYNNYWATEIGWENKKKGWGKSSTGNVDWKATIRRNYKKSAVYKER